MASPLKLAAVVTLDTSRVAPSVQTTKQGISSIGASAEASAAQVQKLVDAQLRIAQPAANMNTRAADISAYGIQLDQLQAKFDPLFAANKKLQAAIQEINQAQSVGAISASNSPSFWARAARSWDCAANASCGSRGRPAALA